jgi:hypothetical protein
MFFPSTGISPNFFFQWRRAHKLPQARSQRLVRRDPKYDGKNGTHFNSATSDCDVFVYWKNRPPFSLHHVRIHVFTTVFLRRVFFNKPRPPTTRLTFRNRTGKTSNTKRAFQCCSRATSRTFGHSNIVRRTALVGCRFEHALRGSHYSCLRRISMNTQSASYTNSQVYRSHNTFHIRRHKLNYSW